jgi:diguanylate cyclase (GGDEF)-like protein
MIAVGLVSYLSIRLAFQVGFATNDIVAIWPAVAISYWAVRRFGPWAMVPIFLADAINLIFFVPHLVPIGFINGFGNAIAPWIGVMFERIWSKAENPFENVRSTLVSILVGMSTLSLVAAIIGTSNISIYYQIPLPAAAGLFWTWFLSDFTGCLVFAPVLFLVPQIQLTAVKRKDLLVDSLVIFVSMFGVWLTTSTGFSDSLGHYPTVFLTMPAMIWLSMREDTPRVMLGITLLALGSFIFTIQVVDNLGSASWMALQLYIVVIVFSAYVVHAMQLERTHLVKTLAMERDILEQRVLERTNELEKLATIDPLTGALNRRSFFRTAEQEFKRARGEKPISLILLDIDKFKNVNDTYGHATGDEVLVTMTKTIQNMIRGGADNLARMGGEEFAILLPETNLEGAVQTAERLRTAIENLSFLSATVIKQPNQNTPREFHITCSFGVAECDLNIADINQTFSYADKALYEAKNKGRNQVARHT